MRDYIITANPISFYWMHVPKRHFFKLTFKRPKYRHSYPSCPSHLLLSVALVGLREKDHSGVHSANQRLCPSHPYTTDITIYSWFSLLKIVNQIWIMKGSILHLLRCGFNSNTSLNLMTPFTFWAWRFHNFHAAEKLINTFKEAIYFV